MTVQYKGRPRYTCGYLHQQAGEPICQNVWADAVDQQVRDWFFATLSAAEIDTSSRVLQEADQNRSKLFKAQRQQVERLRHEAHLAERQYRHSEPENRLVTAELERRWEQALRELKQAEETLSTAEEKNSSWAIPVELLDMLRDVGRRLPEFWNEHLLSWPQKKALLRCLVDKVVLRRKGDHVHVRVAWRGGDVTSGDVPVTVGRFTQLSAASEIEATVLRMTKAGHNDREIAQQLTAAGHRSPKSSTLLPTTVAKIRLRHGIHQTTAQAHPHVIPGYLRAYQIAKALQIQAHWIYDRIRNGTVRVAKDPVYETYLFPDKPETLQQFRQLFEGKLTYLQF